jgi:phosphatidylglycerophosphatase A
LILGWWLRAAVDPYLLLLLAFVSFRLFDIVKPWPVGWLDRAIGGGLGVMIDDIAAAIMGALCVLGFSYVALVASI